MQLESVNLGRRQTIDLGTRLVDTGIDKRPVERAFVGRLGLVGDVVADQKHHGGLDQAVYLYSREDYAWWESELGSALAPGTFGENLTVSSLGAEPRPGDRLRVGGAVLELTAPRIPCAVFADRMGERRWVKRFAAAERPGAYARVLEEGEVAPGDPVQLEPTGAGHPTMVELMRLYYDKSAAPDRLRRALAAPIAERERVALERRLVRSTA
jgi:MOSC domain-containing protein YiiM